MKLLRKEVKWEIHKECDECHKTMNLVTDTYINFVNHKRGIDEIYHVECFIRDIISPGTLDTVRQKALP